MSKNLKKEAVKKFAEEGKVLDEDLKVASTKLLETTGVMHSFMQALQTSGFREYIDYMGRPWYSFWFNLLVGIARGLGFVIGATVVVALVVWIISRILAQIPFIGEFFETLGQFLSKENIEKIQDQNFLESASNFYEAFKTNVLQSYGNIDIPK